MQVTNRVNTVGKFKTTNAEDRRFFKELANLLEEHNASIGSSEWLNVCINGSHSELKFPVRGQLCSEKISANTIRKALEKDMLDYYKDKNIAPV